MDGNRDCPKGGTCAPITPQRGSECRKCGPIAQALVVEATACSWGHTCPARAVAEVSVQMPGGARSSPSTDAHGSCATTTCAARS